MNLIKNSCGGRGCSVRIILPYSRISGNVHSRMFPISNDTKEILPIANTPIQTKAFKKAA